RRFDDAPRPGRLRRPPRDSLENRKSDHAETKVPDLAGVRVPRLPVQLEAGRINDHLAERLGRLGLRVHHPPPYREIDLAGHAVRDLLDLRELLALVVERLDLAVPLADLLSRLGRILRAEGIEDFRFGEIEVGAGRLEDVGQGLALGVELFALRDELGQGAGHVAPSWLCAEGPSRKAKTARLGAVCAVFWPSEGSYFDRGRAV